MFFDAALRNYIFKYLYLSFYSRASYFKNRIQKLYLCSESKTRARSEKKLKSLDRALDRFPNMNIIFKFRNQPRPRSKTNNSKSLWIALLIDF